MALTRRLSSGEQMVYQVCRAWHSAADEESAREPRVRCEFGGWWQHDVALVGLSGERCATERGDAGLMPWEAGAFLAGAWAGAAEAA